jgi:hypothetical protein
MIILLVAAAVVVGTPLIAAVLVTIASLREDAGHSLTGRAPSWIDAAARRLLQVQPSGQARRATPRVPRPRTPDHDESARQLTKPRA